MRAYVFVRSCACIPYDQNTAIPFDRVNNKNMSKDKYASFKLCSDPTASDSPTYEQAVRYFSDGTPEEWLLYLDAVQQVLTGQNVTTGPQKYSMHRRLLKGLSLIHI